MVMHAERILNARRVRDGKSCNQLWNGSTTSALTFEDFGCWASVRKPIPRRTSKLDLQNVEAVYLGKARNKVGSWFWCEALGLCTSTQYTLEPLRYPFKDGTFGTSDDINIDIEEEHPWSAPDDDDDSSSSSSSSPDSTEPDSDDTAGSTLEETVTETESDAPGGDGVLQPGDEPSSGSASPAPAPRRGRSSGVTFDQSIFSFDALDRMNVDSNGRAYAVYYKHLKNPHLLGPTLTKLAMHAAMFSASPGGGCYVPSPRENIDKIEDPCIREMWQESDVKEVKGLFDSGCVEEMLMEDMPEGRKITGSTMQRKIKSDGTCKSRGCAQGFSMIAGDDFDRVHCPTLVHSSFRCIISMAAALNLKLSSADFTQAFLNATLDESEYIYMRPLPGCRTHDENGKALVWLVKKSLYGMKQSGRNWYFMLKDFMIQQGFKQSGADPCVYTKRTKNGVIIVGTYVDDLIIGASSTADRDAFLDEVAKKFKITREDVLTSMLGMRIEQTKEHITINHRPLIEKTAARFLGENHKPLKHATPATPKLPEMVNLALDSTAPPSETLLAMFRALVGALLFVAVTARPDVSYAVGMLSRVMNKPTEALMEAAERVLHYLWNTRHLGLRFMRGVPVRLYGMSDSDWTTRRSTSGYAFFMAGATVAYMSKQQPVVAMSSFEAELMSACAACLEAVFLRALMADLGMPCDGPTWIGVDNKAVVDVSHDYVSGSRVKHIERRWFKVRELVEQAAVAVEHVATAVNVADIFTKPLDRTLFIAHRDKLLNMAADE